MIKDAKLIAIYGRRGSGKSTLAKQMMHKAKRIVVFDPQDEYEAAGFKTVCDLQELLREIKRCWRTEFRLAWVPIAGDEPAELHRLVSLLWKVQAPYEAGTDDRKLTLVVEEMDLSYPVHSLPAELNGMARACNQGRHAGLEIIGITQRPANISATFRGNVSESNIFPLAFASDKTTVLQMIGREHDERLRTLPDHSYIRFANGDVEVGTNPPIK